MQMINEPFVALLSFIKLGGPVVGMLMAISVIALAVMLYKFTQFARFRVGRPMRATRAVELWTSGIHNAALEHARAGRSATAKSVARAIELKIHLAKTQVSSRPGIDEPSIKEVEEAVSLAASQRLHELRSGFRLLDTIAQIAPLLGLFGTVLGMFEAFQKLQGAGSSIDPSILAGGIWVALLTTAVGLAVAMPTSVALTWFESRLEDERVAIQTLASRILSPATTQERINESVQHMSADMTASYLEQVPAR